MKIGFKKIKLKQHYAVIAVTCFVTLIISFFFLYQISSLNKEIFLSKEDIDSYNYRIKTLLRSSPSPTRNNINSLKNDAEYLAKEVFDLKATFGTPYINPLKQLLFTLNTQKINRQNSSDTKTDSDKTNSDLAKQTTLNFFLSNWVEFYKKNKINKGNASNIFRQYLQSKGYSEEICIKAINSFHNYLQIETLLDIDPVTSDVFLMHALGLPLTISRIQCRKFIKETQQKLNKLIWKNKLMHHPNEFILFTEFTTMPNDDQIPYIINYLWFYDDLIKKLINSKIKTLDSYKKINGLRGSAKDNITVLKYEIEISGTLKSIRTFINSLQSSYKENRIYKIDFLSLEKLTDETENLKIPGKKKKPSIEVIIGRPNLIKTKIDMSYFIYNKPLVRL